MRGNGIKKPAESERNTRVNNRKSVVVEKTIEEGQRITLDDLAIKRPGTGIQPKYLEQLIGRTSARCIEKDEVLKWEDIR
jgi:N-acetylneuraminate synthase